MRSEFLRRVLSSLGRPGPAPGPPCAPLVRREVGGAGTAHPPDVKASWPEAGGARGVRVTLGLPGCAAWAASHGSLPHHESKLTQGACRGICW